MNKYCSAHDIVAFACVELNVPIPLELLYNMTPTDPLYKALVEAFKARERRLDGRNALLCAVIANCMTSGKKKFEPKDFLPKASKDYEDESDLKANFIKYNEAVRNKQHTT